MEPLISPINTNGSVKRNQNLSNLSNLFLKKKDILSGIFKSDFTADVQSVLFNYNCTNNKPVYCSIEL